MARRSFTQIGEAARTAASHVIFVLALLTPIAASASPDAEAEQPTDPTTIQHPDDPGIAEIVVTGRKAAVETSIDRKSFSLSDDIQASAGSVADVMRNLPSISVDVEGNPSLRGDENVLILIDGAPAPMLNSGNRGAALQQMGADTIDRIEVITNPAANFKQDGAAGIINIITKKNKKTDSATLQANIGSEGRANVGGKGTYQLGTATLHSTVSLRHDLRTRISTGERIVRDPISSTSISSSNQRLLTNNDRWFKAVTLGADVDLTDADKISAEGSYSRRAGDTKFLEENLNHDAFNALTSRYNREQAGTEREVNSMGSLRYHHKDGASGDEFTLSAQQSEETEIQHQQYQDIQIIPALPTSFENRDTHQVERKREASTEYKTRSKNGAKLIFGYNFESGDNSYDNKASKRATAASAPIANPQFTNQFTADQTVHALYSSAEQSFDDWTILTGLRLEQADTHTNELTSGLRASNDYFKAHPTLHITHDLSEHSLLNFSYGHRVRRPDPEDLNPYPAQQDAITLKQGNPRLRPEEIHSLEMGWTYDRDAMSHSATVYLRKNYNMITSVTRAVDPTTVVVTKENLGKRMSGGVELTSSGKVTEDVSYNLSGTAFYNRIDAANLGFPGTKSSFGYDAKTALNWRMTNKSTAQINLAVAGKRLTPQGYRPSSNAVDLGFRHQLKDNLILTATVSDIFETRRDGLIVLTPALSDSYIRRQTGRIAYVGVSWSLTGKSKASDKFDYEN
ncbi:MAG: TonB-dependent receptor [Rhodospirillaceae bacterium]|nr:TonB-dependent receptor [Rhodospirillaceae bacterium]